MDGTVPTTIVVYKKKHNTIILKFHETSYTEDPQLGQDVGSITNAVITWEIKLLLRIAINAF